MNRHPWRTRAGLLIIINAFAAVGVTLGFAGQVETYTALAIAFVALLADLGIVTDGEDETTPINDPVGKDGLPLISWSQAQEMMSQVQQQPTELHHKPPPDEDLV